MAVTQLFYHVGPKSQLSQVIFSGLFFHLRIAFSGCQSPSSTFKGAERGAVHRSSEHRDDVREKSRRRIARYFQGRRVLEGNFYFEIKLECTYIFF